MLTSWSRPSRRELARPGKSNPALHGTPARPARAGVLLPGSVPSISRGTPGARGFLLAALCALAACEHPPLEDLDAARAAMERAAAEICAFQACAARARVRARSAAAIRDLTAFLPRIHALARHAWDEEGADALLQAEVALGEAKTAFAQEDYERAGEAAERGQARLAGAVAGLNRAFDALHASPRRAAWKKWVRQTLSESGRTGRPVILVDKLRRQLRLFQGQDEVAWYPADLGIAGVATKTRADDDATPEGRYRVTEIRGPGQTRYYRALMLDYPNAEDRERFRKLQRSGRVPKDKGIGSLIEIHGHGGRSQDWTRGCVALENDEMDDLVPRVEVGTAVTIVGTIPEEAVP